MHIPFDIFLALRYLRPKRTFLSIITLLTVLGPCLGVAVLIIVRSVMAGFDKDIKEGIMNMQANIVVYPGDGYGSFSRPDSIIKDLERLPFGIKAAPEIEANALIQLKTTVIPKIVRGIDPAQESKVSKIQENFNDPSLVLKEGQAVIGKRLAWQTGLRIGDEFLIHSPARLTAGIKWREDGSVDIAKPDEMYLPEQVKVVGFYEMGIADFDDNVIILHQDQAADLTGIPWGGATTIQCSVPDPMNMSETMTSLRRNFPRLTFVSWQERNAILFNTLQNEQTMMTFLMAFIILVASFSIASTLITVVVQKTREIGILKAVGFSGGAIARIFLLQGTIIGTIGTLLGTGAGLLVLANREKIAALLSMILGHDVFPAELYHLTNIPAVTSATDLLVIICSSVAICILASLFPAIYASSFSPAASLKTDN